MKSINNFLTEEKLENIYTNLTKGTILYIVLDKDKWSDNSNKHKCSKIIVKDVTNRGKETLFGGDKVNTTYVRLESNTFNITSFLIFDKQNETKKEFFVKRIHAEGTTWYFAGISKEAVISALDSKYRKQLEEVDDKILKLQKDIEELNIEKQQIEDKLKIELED